MILAPGIVVVAVGSLPDAAPFWLIHLGAIFAGFGMGLAYSAHAQLALRSVEERHVGGATASLQLSDNLGIALGTGVVGAVVAFGDDLGRTAGTVMAVALDGSGSRCRRRRVPLTSDARMSHLRPGVHTPDTRSVTCRG